MSPPGSTRVTVITTVPKEIEMNTMFGCESMISSARTTQISPHSVHKHTLAMLRHRLAECNMEKRKFTVLLIVVMSGTLLKSALLLKMTP